MDQDTLKVILFFNSSLASSKTKNIYLLYLNTDFCYVKNFLEHFAENRTTF